MAGLLLAVALQELCSGTALDGKEKGDSVPLEQGGSEKAPQGSRVQKNACE